MTGITGPMITYHEESEVEHYSVGKLIDVRKVGRHIEIKVRWEGYDSRDDTCEPTQ